MANDARFAGTRLDLEREALHVAVARPQSQTILVVDDDEQIRTLASRILVSEGYGVMTADDGAEGLAIYRRYRRAIGAVLLDMAMPEMNGAQFIRSLRIVDPTARILLSSGHDVDPFLQAEGVWPSAFLPKPYRPKALIEAIGGLIGL